MIEEFQIDNIMAELSKPAINYVDFEAWNLIHVFNPQTGRHKPFMWGANSLHEFFKKRG